MNQKKAQRISKALSDPNRVMIIQQIKKKDDVLYCCDIHEVIDLAQPSICHHLKLLTDAEIISSEKEGRNVKYTLNKDVLDEYITFIKSLQTTA
jgi:ArsR family transcriptional regulator